MHTCRSSSPWQKALLARVSWFCDAICRFGRCAVSARRVPEMPLSYPLHAPAKPDQPRIQHLPKLNVATLFVSGTRDPFGTIEEIEGARRLIPAKTQLVVVEGAGHDLGFKGKKKQEDLPDLVLANFQKFFV